MGAIGSAASGIKGVTSLLSGLFGSSGGSANAGLSDQEAALMQYERSQNILKNNSYAASTGTGMGTGVSFEDAAAGIGAAQTGAGIVDKQLAANLAAQQTSIQSLANSAGFGTQSNSGVNTTPNVSTGSSGSGNTSSDTTSVG